MDIQKIIDKGSRQMRQLTIFIVLLTLPLLIYEFFNFQTTTMLIVQIIYSILVIGFPVLMMRGVSLRWPFFILLLNLSMFAFYMGGSRMANFERGEISLMSYMSVVAGLSYLASGIYFAASQEIAVYLNFQIEQRKKLKPLKSDSE